MPPSAVECRRVPPATIEETRSPPAQAPLLAKFKPTCLEAAYIPRRTAFIDQARDRLPRDCR